MWSIKKGFKLFPIEMLVLTKRSSGKEFNLLGTEVFLEVETAEREQKIRESFKKIPGAWRDLFSKISNDEKIFVSSLFSKCSFHLCKTH